MLFHGLEDLTGEILFIEMSKQKKMLKLVKNKTLPVLWLSVEDG